jgi:hypothetical protein
MIGGNGGFREHTLLHLEHIKSLYPMLILP